MKQPQHTSPAAALVAWLLVANPMAVPMAFEARAARAAAAPVCAGDCDGNGGVRIDEIISLVNIALGSTEVGGCWAGDVNGDGAITVDEIVVAVNHALRGCPTGTIVRRFDFREGLLGWQGGFADYPASAEPTLDLVAELRFLPEEVGGADTAFYLQGKNTSDDLFMFLKRRLGAEDGLVRKQDYEVRFTIRFASNAPSGCSGIGGAPGESVALKVGASTVEPVAMVDAQGDLRMNVDKGQQFMDGPAASVVGNIANGIDCASLPDLANAPYVSLERTRTHQTIVRASDAGELWLLVGTDSGFEGLTGLYYQEIEVELIAVGS